MGRSLLMAVFAAPADWRTRDYNQKIDTLPSRAISALYDGGLLNIDDILDEAPEDVDIEDDEAAEGVYLEKAARDRLKIALSELRDAAGTRDLYESELEPGWVLLETGGQSWGDSPTAAYDPLMMLGVAGIFDAVKYARVTREDKRRFDREFEIGKLINEIGDADVADVLGDLVHDNCTRDASNINNEGLDAQISYLVNDCGMSVEDVRRTLLREGLLPAAD